MKRIGLLIFVIVFTCSLNTSAQTIMTIAGNGIAGFSGDAGAATAAEIFGPYGIALDGLGNTYFVDQGNQRIRKINASGTISTIAGTGVAGYNGDTVAINSELNNPTGVAADARGNVYIADYGNNRVRKIDTAGRISTIAGTGIARFWGDNGYADTAMLNGPSAVAVDKNGNIYIADKANQRVRKIDINGIITTIAGTGLAGYNGDNFPSGTMADLSNPIAVTTDIKGNVYIVDENNNRVRKVDTFNRISTVFGDGTLGFSPDGLLAVNSSLYRPNGVAVDSLGNIYVADEFNYRIRRADYNSNTVITLAGNGTSGFNGDTAAAINCEIRDCKGIAVDQGGNVYFSDWSNNRVNYITSTVSVKNVYQSISQVSVYPNPNNGSFTINITSQDNELAHIVVTNVLGQTVKEINAATNKSQSVDLNAAAGVYFITATTANGMWNGKLEVSSK